MKRNGKSDDLFYLQLSLIIYILLISIGGYFSFPIDFSSFLPPIEIHKRNFSIFSIIFFLLSLVISYMCTIYFRKKLKIKKIIEIITFIFLNSIIIGGMFGVVLLVAAWDHNPQNEIHKEGYINYSYLMMLAISGTLFFGFLILIIESISLIISIVLTRILLILNGR